jgi:hypothetical protein
LLEKCETILQDEYSSKTRKLKLKGFPGEQ